MSVSVTSTPAPLSILSSIGETGHPSGTIVDNYANTTTYPQASGLYFSNQGNCTSGLTCGGLTVAGCAVKVTQAGLN